MDNSPALAANMEGQRSASDPVCNLIDSIIEVKCRQQNPEVKVRVTEEQRIKLLKNYLQLETLKEERNGKFLFEYDQGLDTFVEEVVV
ncbi:MAG: hypothetical protein ACFB0D_16545 [Phormidesmis sp.]